MLVVVTDLSVERVVVMGCVLLMLILLLVLLLMVMEECLLLVLVLVLHRRAHRSPRIPAHPVRAPSRPRT